MSATLPAQSLRWQLVCFMTHALMFTIPSTHIDSIIISVYITSAEGCHGQQGLSISLDTSIDSQTLSDGVLEEILEITTQATSTLTLSLPALFLAHFSTTPTTAPTRGGFNRTYPPPSTPETL